MELTSDNLFLFILKKYKYRENKLKQKSPPENKKLNLKKQNLSGNKDEKPKIKKFTKGLIINNSNISNFVYNSTELFINECYKNLEYLSITNNYIKNLDFIMKLPNLFYLDLYRNPLEELTALNNKNIFGYLRLSIELYNERKILNIHDLQCGILDIELKHKKYLKIFTMHNNHICMLNNQILYLIDKIKRAEERIKANNNKKKKTLTKNDLSNISAHSNSNSDTTNNNELQKDSSKNVLMNSVTLSLNLDTKREYIPEKPVEKVVQYNPMLIKIQNYFNDYESEIKSKLSSENHRMYEKRRKTISLMINNDFFKSKNMEENSRYLGIEKEKLILLFNIYKKISLFNRERNNNTYYVGNVDSIYMNLNIDNIFIREIETILKNKSLKEIRTLIIILIALAFYIIGTISEKMFQAIFDFILEKYYGYEDNKKPPNFSDFGNIHYLTFYYSTYDYIYKRIIELEKNINIEKYRDILKVLKLEKLILRSNYINNKFKENKSKDNNTEFCQFKKNRIIKEIRSIKELKLTKEFLILIQFLSDYIIYEKIEEIIINKSYPGEYSYLIELKETIEETEFQINNKNFLSCLSLSALKFEKNKKERIFNKFYFEENRVKKIQNKEFKNYMINDLNRSNSMSNLNTSIIVSNIFNNSKSNFNNINNYFEEDEYKKSDDIDVDECFCVDSVRKNFTFSNSKINNTSYKFLSKKINNKINNRYIKKENNSSNENSYEKEEFNTLNANVQLPFIQTNQNQRQNMFENVDFLKKMVFDPEFLSQHARYILKFEKLTKKNSKKSPKNLHINKMRKKIHFLNENMKPISYNSSKLGFVHSSYDKNNTSKFQKNPFNNSKMNVYLESSNNENYNPMYYSNNSTNNINSSPLDFTNYAINNYRFQNISEFSRNNKMKITFDDKFRKKEYLFHNNNNELNMYYFGIPESFPGMTLINFGKTKNKTFSKNIKLIKKKKNLSKNNIKEEKKSHKAEVINKIRETVKNNILRNARRVAFSMYQ